MLKEYYNMLDLNPGANADEIKKAYRLKAKLVHPDANHRPEAHFQFIRMKEAFDILLKVKNLETCRRTSAGPFSHPHDPYFQSAHHRYAHTCSARAKHYRKENDEGGDFLDSRIGRTLYLAVHVLFFFMGLLIFAGPLYNLITRGFDPYISLFDSLFATVAAMVFGVIMIVRITWSFVRFVKCGF